jgi:hypothetical protein
MEHTKKMVLVEPRQIEKWKETMVDKTLSKLDGDMYEILHRNMADDNKAKLYSNSLSRYLNIDKPNIVTKFESTDAAAAAVASAATVATNTQAPKPHATDELNLIEYEVLESVPKKWKSQASRLLTHLNVNPDIRWNAKGELVLKNATIPKSHIVDLVNDLLRKRASVSIPTGWRQLADALKDSNIPHDLIGNQDRWIYINGSSDETPPVTPSRKRRKHQALTNWAAY